MPIRLTFFVLCILAFLNHSVYGQNIPVKGVWLTNVASNALDSRDNIRQAVELCSQSGINNIYVVTWNKARTLYPSKIMQQKFGIPIMERFSGRDPLKEVIEEAHAKNIKVHAWFEFGFASSYQENGGMIIKKYPHWAALDKDGKLVTKNGFEWMNPFLPEVQRFITSLLKEVVVNYEIDGIQGDDRLPAVPSTAGYDPYTVKLYKAQHGGKNPPENYRDAAWIDWRADMLTSFLGKLYKEMKKLKPGLTISMAPSIHPWAKEEYLQDWPSWMAKGYVDYVMPQVYRYNIQAYSTALAAQVKMLKDNDKNKLYPGVLLQVNGKNPTQGFLDSMIMENRNQGIKGECFFFFEGLKKFPGYLENYHNK